MIVLIILWGGHFKKHNVPPVRLLREFRLADRKDEAKAGDKVLVEEVFKPEDRREIPQTPLPEPRPSKSKPGFR